MKPISLSLAALLVLMSGCAAYNAPTKEAKQPVGSMTGYVLNSRNPWHGGVVGGAGGVLVAATAADVSYRGSWEAALQNRPVEYKTEDGKALYRADPGTYSEGTRCRSVRERIWVDGGLVKDKVKDVCEAERPEKSGKE